MFTFSKEIAVKFRDLSSEGKVKTIIRFLNSINGSEIRYITLDGVIEKPLNGLDDKEKEYYHLEFDITDRAASESSLLIRRQDFSYHKPERSVKVSSNDYTDKVLTKFIMENGDYLSSMRVIFVEPEPFGRGIMFFKTLNPKEYRFRRDFRHRWMMLPRY